MDHATTNRIYDEFDPIFNWKTEQGFETLTLYLPGFRREQLKVQITTTRKLRVMGERLAGANKWIRFRKEFPVQSNVDVDSIAAKFEGSNLVLNLPIIHEPRAKQTSPIVTKETPKLPSPEVKETELKQTREKEAELEKQDEKVQAKEKEPVRSEKEEASKNVCDGVKQDYRNKMNAYKENLGGYVELMKHNKTAITTGMIAPAAAVLLLSLGFFAGRMFTSYEM